MNCDYNCDKCTLRDDCDDYLHFEDDWLSERYYGENEDAECEK